MSTEELGQLINVVASITLFEMMVAIGLGVSVADVARVAADWRLVGKAIISAAFQQARLSPACSAAMAVAWCSLQRKCDG